MTEAILRGYTEIPEDAAKTLLESGWPVEVRYFIEKQPKATVTTRMLTRSKPKSFAIGNLVGPGELTPDDLNLRQGMGRRHYGEKALEILEQRGPMRRPALVKQLRIRAHKKGATKSDIASQVTHLIKLGVLQDLGPDEK